MIGILLIACLALVQLSAGVFICPPIHNHRLHPHEYDCTKFYYCEYGDQRVTATNCAPGTWFSYSQQVCVHPADSECVDGGSSSTTSTTTVSTTSRRPSDRCPPDNSVHMLLPHPDDCTKFFYCVWGDEVERDCPAGLHFNPTLMVCDWPWDAGCDNSITPSTPSTTTTSTTPGPIRDRCIDNCNEFPWAHDTDCDKFWRCVGDEAVLVQCTEGLHFNPVKGSCDFTCYAECETTPSRCVEDCNIPPWAHETDCDKYYRCEGEKEVLVECSLGLHFNPEKGSCDFTCYAGCTL